MVRDNRSTLGTNFTVSIEAASGVTTGISAQDRARTVQAAVAPEARPEDIVQPGHIFPLMAQAGGVLARAGHTEAGCDLANLAGLTPAAVICEILKDDGTMARLPDLLEFGARHGLAIGSILLWPFTLVYRWLRVGNPFKHAQAKRIVILRSIAQVARGVGGKLDELSVCGDSAADPLMIPFLIGVGIRSLSVAPARIDEVRSLLGRLGIAEAQEVAGRMLAIRKVREMEAYLQGLARRLQPPGEETEEATWRRANGLPWSRTTTASGTWWNGWTGTRKNC
jgi:hypothetical protein